MDQLGKDLELVMVAMAKQDDVVLVRRVPSREIRKQMLEIGIDLPQFVLLNEREKLAQRKLNELSPWAWSPKNHTVAQPLTASTFHSVVPWQASLEDLYRKSWDAARLGEWLNQSNVPNWFASVDCVGIPVNSASDMSSALNDLSDRGYPTAIFKLDLASSGRGQRRIDCGGNLSSEGEAWLNSMFATGALKADSGLQITPRPVGIVEPELDRLTDLSFLWNLRRDSQVPDFLGWTRPMITAGRRYVGTRLGNSLGDCDERIKRFLLAERCAVIQTLVEWLEARVVPELNRRNFVGYFGVDTMVFQDESGELKIKPLVELNPRMTMGHVALNLEKRIAPGVDAEFRILTKAQWDLSHKQLAGIPLNKLKDGRWKSGVIWLGEVDENTKLIPALLIGPEACEQFYDALR